MGRPPQSAERPPLSLDLIADAALELVDREGLGALSMRRIGAALGVGAMALYHHFPNKDALIEAMLRRNASAPIPELTGNWRADVTMLMHAVYEQLSVHPGLLPLRWERRVTSPEAKRIREQERRIFEAAGITGDLALNVHRLLGSYVVGVVVAGIEARRAIPNKECLAQFEIGLDILLDGIEARQHSAKRATHPRPRKSQSR